MKKIQTGVQVSRACKKTASTLGCVPSPTRGKGLVCRRDRNGKRKYLRVLGRLAGAISWGSPPAYCVRRGERPKEAAPWGTFETLDFYDDSAECGEEEIATVWDAIQSAGVEPPVVGEVGSLGPPTTFDQDNGAPGAPTEACVAGRHPENCDEEETRGGVGGDPGSGDRSDWSGPYPSDQGGVKACEQLAESRESLDEGSRLNQVAYRPPGRATRVPCGCCIEDEWAARERSAMADWPLTRSFDIDVPVPGTHSLCPLVFSTFVPEGETTSMNPTDALVSELIPTGTPECNCPSSRFGGYRCVCSERKKQDEVGKAFESLSDTRESPSAAATYPPPLYPSPSSPCAVCLRAHPLPVVVAFRTGTVEAFKEWFESTPRCVRNNAVSSVHGFFGDHRDEYVRRLARDASAPDPPADESRTLEALSKLLADVPPAFLTSPFDRNEFVLAARSHRTAELDLEGAYKMWQDASTPDELQDANMAVDSALENLQDCCDRVFQEYLLGLGFRHVAGLSYSKAAADSALRSAIGSAGSPGNGRFVYPGLPTDRWDGVLRTDTDAAIAFGIYMARKGLNVNDPREMREKMFQQVERLTQPVPPLSPPQAVKKTKMLAILRRICETFFADALQGRQQAPVPSSYKSCLESNRKQGGKRRVLFDEPADWVTRARPAGSYGTDPKLLERFGPVDGVDDTWITEPMSILSAGKVRGISLASVRLEQFAWMNAYMFQRIRGCAWMIGGRSVADWVAATSPKYKEGLFWLSGDLKAATDMLDGDFMREVCRWFADTAYPDFPDAYRRMTESCTDAFFGDVVGDLGIKWAIAMGRQTRGQLMACDFSFPVLCLIGFLIGIDTVGLLDEFHYLAISATDKHFASSVRKCKRFGVNGDDFVTRVKRDEAPRWLDAVAVTGGVPEPAKSPFDRTYFTVNSELWKCDQEGTRAMPTLLPAMLMHLHGQTEHKPMDSKWLTLFTSPGNPCMPGSRLWERFALDLLLLPDVSRTAGGLGSSQPCDNERVRRARVAYAATRAPETAAILAPFAQGAASVICRVSRTSAEFRLGNTLEDHKYGPAQEGWYDRAALMSQTQKRFQVRRSTRWTPAPVRAPFDLDAVKRRAALPDLLEHEEQALHQELHGRVYAVHRPDLEDPLLPASYDPPPSTILSEMKLQQIRSAEDQRQTRHGLSPQVARIPQSSLQAARATSAPEFVSHVPACVPHRPSHSVRSAPLRMQSDPSLPAQSHSAYLIGPVLVSAFQKQLARWREEDIESQRRDALSHL